MSFQSAMDPSRKFSNVFKQRKFDEVHSKKENEESPKHGMDVDRAVATTEEPKETKQHDLDTDPVVSAHGPAHTVTISHDNENNTHHVESDHEDGFKNSSDHETSAEAHEQGGKLCNVSLKKSGEEGDQAGAASEGDNDNTDAFEMPDLV